MLEPADAVRADDDEIGGERRGLVKDRGQRGMAAVMHVGHGKPYEQLLGAARKDGADLIVLGVHGRSALDLGVFGSTTNQLVRRATCPVLTVRT